ncbi:helix-turn-helix domain-containing protein [Beijerinckia mobilis]|uniref:helix-turn-helix domain-containing protein n=1 Tax=Beijerinckia mobilis TaxID=231434 RepID=UPI0005599D3A|nr:helix-turn-helix transcriptional regulator [Beijerinckia mobilis]
MIINFPEVDPADRAVGTRVRQWREKRGISPAELADALHLTRSELIRAEGGRAHLSAMQLYAVTLHLRIPMRLLFED